MDKASQTKEWRNKKVIRVSKGILHNIFVIYFRLHDQEHVVNESVLSDTQKNFLNGSIDIAKFAMDSREFQDICNYYMLRKEMFLMRKEYYMELLEEKYTSKVMSLADMLINQSES